MDGTTPIPVGASEAVLKKSDEMPPGSQKVEELDFNKFTGTVDELVEGMKYMGFQASSIGEAIQIINEMVKRKKLHSPSCSFVIQLPFSYIFVEILMLYSNGKAPVSRLSSHTSRTNANYSNSAHIATLKRMTRPPFS